MPTLSLTACSQIEKDLRILKQNEKDFEAFNIAMDKMKNADISKDVQLLTTLSKDSMIYAKHLGFMYAPYILLDDYFIRNISQENSPLNVSNKHIKFSNFKHDDIDYANATNKILEENMSSTGKVFKNLQEITDFGQHFVELLKVLPYKILPTFTPAQEGVYTPIHNAMSLSSDFLSGKIMAVADLGVYGFSNLIAYKITKSTLEFTPAFLMIVAGLWVFVFFAISLFLYYFVSPFVLAYALGSQQTEAIKSFIARGVVLALKPIKLVISIVIALVALDITNEMLAFTEHVIIQNMIDKSSVGWWIFTMFTFFQGLFHVISLVVAAIMAFVLVFKGADMIIALFGFKDSGVNVKEVIGGDIERGTDKVSPK